MEAFYAEIRAAHIGAVVLSGLLMLLRGVARNALDARWTMAAPVRILSYTIDSILLTAALMLMTIGRQYPLVDSWLTTKVVLLVLYILLGYRALRAPNARSRWASLAGAALIYALIVGVARAHDPLGWFA